MKFVVDTEVLQEMLSVVNDEEGRNQYLLRSIKSLLVGKETPWAKEQKKEKGKAALGAYSSEFEQFWAAYPSRQGSKQGKAEAFKAWNKAVAAVEKGCGWRPGEATKKCEEKLAGICFKALEWQKLQESWTKDDGKFVPMAATYLNQKRFEDEPIVVEMERYQNADGIWCTRPKGGK